MSNIFNLTRRNVIQENCASCIVNLFGLLNTHTKKKRSTVKTQELRPGRMYGCINYKIKEFFVLANTYKKDFCILYWCYKHNKKCDVKETIYYLEAGEPVLDYVEIR